MIVHGHSIEVTFFGFGFQCSIVVNIIVVLCAFSAIHVVGNHLIVHP